MPRIMAEHHGQISLTLKFVTTPCMHVMVNGGQTAQHAQNRQNKMQLKRVHAKRNQVAIGLGGLVIGLGGLMIGLYNLPLLHHPL